MAFERQRYSIAESKSGSDGFFNKYLRDFEGLANDVAQSRQRSQGMRHGEVGDETASYRHNDPRAASGTRQTFQYHDNNAMSRMLIDQEHKLSVNENMLKQAQDQCHYYQNRCDKLELRVE